MGRSIGRSAFAKSYNGYASASMVALAKPIWTLDDGEAFLLAVAANVPAWQRDGLCVEHPEADWFPPKGGSTRSAKVVCRRSLVQAECLAYALDLEPGLPGLWGGTSHPERLSLLRRGVTGDLVAKHGVHAVQMPRERARRSVVHARHVRSSGG